MGDTPKDIRDKALLLIGYAGGFRRSELVALDKEDIEITPRGIAICVRRSKTDQLGAGRRIGIPLGKAAHCPVAALERWLSIGAVETGPIFRRVNRHGNILHHRLSSEAVALIVKKRVEAAGFDAETYSGHSLRSGFATSAALIGVPSWKIRQQTGHASELMLSRYIRNVDMFREGAVTSVL
jgi:integrase